MKQFSEKRILSFRVTHNPRAHSHKHKLRFLDLKTLLGINMLLHMHFSDYPSIQYPPDPLPPEVQGLSIIRYNQHRSGAGLDVARGDRSRRRRRPQK